MWGPIGSHRRSRLLAVQLGGGKWLSWLWAWLVFGLGGVAFYGLQRLRTRSPGFASPETPVRALFRQALPDYEIARTHGKDPGRARGALLAAAEPWPAIKDSLAALDRAFPTPDPTCAAVRGLDGAIEDAGLAYWVDCKVSNGRGLVLTYEREGESKWVAGARSVSVARVLRLDALGVELGYLGHAEQQEPVVLLDMIEAEVLQGMGNTVEEEGNDTDRAGLAVWRQAVEERAGGLASARSEVQEYAQALLGLDDELAGKGLALGWTPRFDFSPNLLDSLSRRGVSRAVLERVHLASRAMRQGPGAPALTAALELGALRVEAHEARHGLETGKARPPEPLLRALGTVDASFADAAAEELRAYLGELHDAPVVPCLVIAELSRNASGATAGESPHHFASLVILDRLRKPGQTDADLLKASCQQPEAELRAEAEHAYAEWFGQAMEGATRRTSSPSTLAR